MKTIRIFALLLIIIFYCSSTKAQTAGLLDSEFANSGIAITNFDSEEGNAIAIQTDGKIVVAGTYSYSSGNDFMIVRYNSDGILDNTFGLNGIVTTEVGSSGNFAQALAIQGDGKIVVAGYSSNGSNNDFALVRYTPDGTIDSTFGSNGKIITPIGTYHDHIIDVVIQSDGKIVACGISNSMNFRNHIM